MREPLILGLTLTLAGALVAGCGALDAASDSAPSGGGGNGETTVGAGGGGPLQGDDGEDPKAPPGSKTDTSEGVLRPNVAPTLPAGDWDDNLNFTPWYESYRQAYLDERPVDPVIDTQDRVVIRIESEMGVPIPNAMVDLVDPDTGTTPLGPTSSGGQVLVLGTHDGVDLDGDESVQVTVPSGAPQILSVPTPGDTEWVLTLPGYEPSPPKQLELAFLIDTTYSLGDEIAYLRATINDIHGHIVTVFPDIEIRWGLVAYRDVEDAYLTEVHDFTNLFGELNGWLTGLEAEGGGDYPEALDDGLTELVDLSWTPPGTANVTRMAFIISDAPAHEDKLSNVNLLTEEARQLGIRLYPIGSSGTGDRAEFYLRQSAMLTLGRYLFLLDEAEDESDFVPEDPTLPQGSMPCFHMQNLYRLMNRMIESELTGTRVPAEEIIASVGDPDAEGICTFSDGKTAQL